MWQAIVHGLMLGCALALSVGPVIFTIIKQSLNNGHTGGFSFVIGVWVSDIILVVISNAFSALVAELMEYQNVIAYIGSAFLVAMGVFYLFFKKVTLRTDGGGNNVKFRKRDIMKIFSSGFFINTLNPGVFIFWLSTAAVLATKFTFQQRLVVFAVCISLNIAADVFKVLLAGKLRNRLTLHNLTVINKISGVILVGFGMALLYGTIFLPKGNLSH
jgi:threonine/homoserine/homoserine lactone efflux protein